MVFRGASLFRLAKYLHNGSSVSRQSSLRSWRTYQAGPLRACVSSYPEDLWPLFDDSLLNLLYNGSSLDTRPRSHSFYCARQLVLPKIHFFGTRSHSPDVLKFVRKEMIFGAFTHKSLRVLSYALKPLYIIVPTPRT